MGLDAGGALMLIAVGIALGAALGAGTAQPLEEGSVAVVVSTDGYEEATIALEGTGLQFNAPCSSLLMNIHEVQALSIRNGMEGAIDVRPSTHDVLKEVLEHYGLEVAMVRVDSYSSELYYASVVLRRGNRVLLIDSRPSDAAGIAVRTGAPVYVNATVLRERGLATC